jgi:hypothetical protein
MLLGLVLLLLPFDIIVIVLVFACLSISPAFLLAKNGCTGRVGVREHYDILYMRLQHTPPS